MVTATTRSGHLTWPDLVRVLRVSALARAPQNRDQSPGPGLNREPVGAPGAAGPRFPAPANRESGPGPDSRPNRGPNRGRESGRHDPQC